MLPKILLHTCCIACGASVLEELQANYDPTLYFYNPGIHPREEHDKRLEEAKRFAEHLHYPIIVEKYNHEHWLYLVVGFEHEPERGRRCWICYGDRLKATYKKAKELNFDYFSTALTVSPHKDAKMISKIGLSISRTGDCRFLDQDFKKKNGFKKSIEISRKFNLYRQDYCGCEFSK